MLVIYVRPLIFNYDPLSHTFCCVFSRVAPPYNRNARPASTPLLHRTAHRIDQASSLPHLLSRSQQVPGNVPCAALLPKKLLDLNEVLSCTERARYVYKLCCDDVCQVLLRKRMIMMKHAGL
ncbi:hypothetical protein PC129_g16031 [Phytophthora cactorum]|uniref:Uncharacterized protein n=1 Tax=Phytophthora cactorum TaxID=29920 RepID=A0A8T1HM44_9STRA|nr:hypothetical protein PC112_g19118 [Phytophthora cactorum]KAG2823348.1 hypothetical protein PC111_g10255 [Phytophthora cactorum]KAG2855878.1 hypothetical protein PC113_g12057 [Phytophthora cactorum]KAG2886187.1 hypothetical protein PC114_g19390 [Phytophthora cactorum]KAG2916750.1 hypothetical protein PC115_g10914 [Phytophthora cactorum]